MYVNASQPRAAVTVYQAGTNVGETPAGPREVAERWAPHAPASDSGAAPARGDAKPPTASLVRWGRALLLATLGGVAGTVPLVGLLTNPAGGVLAACSLTRNQGLATRIAVPVVAGLAGLGLYLGGALALHPIGSQAMIPSLAFGALSWGLVGYGRS